MVKNMYTKSKELRVIISRNKREFAHELYDLKNAIEEDEVEMDDTTGELVHPAHERKTWFEKRSRNEVGCKMQL